MKLAPCPLATFFVTLRLADRRSDLLVRELGSLRTAMRAAMKQGPFTIDAITVLPAIAHMILVLPTGEQDVGARVSMIKRRFAQLAKPALIARAGILPNIWHRDHWICPLETAVDLARHRTVIHHAPVEAGLCTQPQDWLHTSLHRDLRVAAVADARPEAPSSPRQIKQIAPALTPL